MWSCLGVGVGGWAERSGGVDLEVFSWLDARF